MYRDLLGWKKSGSGRGSVERDNRLDQFVLPEDALRFDMLGTNRRRRGTRVERETEPIVINRA